MQTHQLKKEFANGLHRMLTLTRISLGAESVAFYWVNRSKEQFVLAAESHDSGSLHCVQRSAFSEHYLDPFRDLTEPVHLSDNRDLSRFRNSSFYLSGGLILPDFKQLILYPIISQKETVAIALFAIQRPEPVSLDHASATLQAFEEFYSFYLSLSDAYTQLRIEQQEWPSYDGLLDQLTELSAGKKGVVKILTTAIDQLILIMQGNEGNNWNPSGSGALVFAVQSLNDWIVVLEKGDTSALTTLSTTIGMNIEKQTLAMNALESGKSEFLVHANPSPHRISTCEAPAKGSSLSVPLLMDGRRVGVFLFSHPNPRFFSGPISHKLINYVRYLSMLIQKSEAERGEEYFQDRSGVLTSDLWQLSLQQIVESGQNRSGQSGDSTETDMQQVQRPTIEKRLVFITPTKLPTLRARYRLEQLQQLQHAIANELKPGNAAVNGWIGRYSEYVFIGFIHGDYPQWEEHILAECSKGFSISEGENLASGTIQTGLHIYSLAMTVSEPQRLLRELNSGLAQVISSKE